MSYGGSDYTSYGGGGGAGGFYAASQGGSQASPGSESKNRASNSLRPVTVKQILEARQSMPDGPFMIDDKEISHITFIGRVRSVAEQATNITYVLDDGTGILDVKQWVDTEDASAASGLGQQLNGHYVRVLGVLKSFGNKKHVGSHKIRLITDFNEVQYHLLEATAAHLRLLRGPPEQFAPAGDGQTETYRGGINDTMMGGMGGGYAGSRPGQGLPDNISGNARLAYQIIKSNLDSNEGVHLNIIKMKSHMSEDAVAKAVNELLSTGAAYTTVDENHVAAMEF